MEKEKGGGGTRGCPVGLAIYCAISEPDTDCPFAKLMT